MARPQQLLTGLGFPEAPRWHDEVLWFSDMALRAVFTVDLEGNLHRQLEVPGRPSGLGWLPDGRLQVVSMEDRRLLRREDDGSLVEVARLESYAPWHCNDMVVDGRGRAYVGNFGFDYRAGQAPRATDLVRVDADGAVHVAATDLLFPNGMVLTPDGRSLIVAETFGGRLTRFRVDVDGGLSDRAEFAALDGNFPDGICLDAEGAVWVASAGTGDVVRVAEGGAVLDLLVSGARGAYACMLGGADRRLLFVCTASTSDHEEAARRRDGAIAVVDVDVPGAGLP